MTDPETILAAICLTTAAALPLGVWMGRQLERESRFEIARRLAASRLGLMEMEPITVRIGCPLCGHDPHEEWRCAIPDGRDPMDVCECPG